MGEILFDGPYPIKRWGPLSNAGIYAIMKSLMPIISCIHIIFLYFIFFGESGDLSE